MRIKYWTVRFVFDPLRIGSTGLGVIALDEGRGEAATRFLSAEDQSSFDALSRKAVSEWMKQLEKDLAEVGRTPQLNVGDYSTIDGLVSRLQRQMNNAIRIDPPGFAAGDSLEQTADLLFRTLIGPRHREPRRRRLTVIRQEVRARYEERAAIRQKLFTRPELAAGGRAADLDLAVAGFRVFELNTAFSFAVEPSTNFAHKVDAWTYKIGLLRDSGGTLKLSGERELSVGESTPVVVVVEPPESDEQRELFAEVTTTWDSLGIRQVSTVDLGRHAAELDNQILSA